MSHKTFLYPESYHSSNGLGNALRQFKDGNVDNESNDCSKEADEISHMTFLYSESFHSSNRLA